jgi:broad specificity phosphatase PhoE
MSSFWFIRHAESESNAGMTSTSPATINITEKGKKQAESIVDYIQDKPTLFVHSPYIRTKQTGQPLFDKLRDVPKVEWPIQEFTYLPHDHYYQTTTMERYPQARRYFRNGNPDQVTGDGAESFNQFRRRVRDTLTKLTNLESDFTVIFGHGWFMRAALWELIVKNDLSREKRKKQWRDFKEKMITSPFPFTLYSIFGLRRWEKTMCNFLLFSSAILIPNGTILQFTVDPSHEIHFIDHVTSHIPKDLQGSNWVDR